MKPHTMLAVGLLISSICTIGTGGSTNIVLTFILQILSGLFYPCIHVGIQTLIMRNTEAAFVGRVGGTITPIFMGLMVLGMSLSGYMKNLLTLFGIYCVSGGLLVIGALLLIPLFQQRDTMDSRRTKHNRTTTG